jgi:hypothetical protein
LLFNATSTMSDCCLIFQLYDGENKLIINEVMMRSALYYSNMLSWIFIVLAHWNNSPRIDMSPYLDTLSWFRSNQSLFFLLNDACLAEKQQIPILFFGLTRPGLEPAIYHTRGEYANYYTTDAVVYIWNVILHAHTSREDIRGIYDILHLKPSHYFVIIYFNRMFFYFREITYRNSKITNDKNQPFFCGKATVQISWMWQSNCPSLVIVLFCYWKYRISIVMLQYRKSSIVYIQYWMYQYRAFTILEYQNRWSIHNTESSSILHPAILVMLVLLSTQYWKL